MTEEKYSPTSAKLLVTEGGHELVVGRTASGKTSMLIDSLQRDWEAKRTTWVISLLSRKLSKSELVDWSASNVDDAVQMLRQLSNMAEQRFQEYSATLVIDDATSLLQEIDVLTEVEFLAEQSPPWLKLRLALQTTLRWGVAGSTILYDTLIENAKEMV